MGGAGHGVTVREEGHPPCSSVQAAHRTTLGGAIPMDVEGILQHSHSEPRVPSPPALLRPAVTDQEPCLLDSWAGRS